MYDNQYFHYIVQNHNFSGELGYEPTLQRFFKKCEDNFFLIFEYEKLFVDNIYKIKAINLNIYISIRDTNIHDIW